MKVFSKLLIILFCLNIISPFVMGGFNGALPVSESVVENNSYFLINDWKELPFKHLKANLSWVNYVNANYHPIRGNWTNTSYDTNQEKIAPHCLSYSAATMADWYSLQTGSILASYNSYLNNRSEKGHNPRELEMIYYERQQWYSLLYNYLGIDLWVTHESIPYILGGYMDILTNPPSNWTNKNDTNIPSSYFRRAF